MFGRGFDSRRLHYKTFKELNPVTKSYGIFYFHYIVFRTPPSMSLQKQFPVWEENIEKRKLGAVNSDRMSHE